MVTKGQALKALLTQDQKVVSWLIPTRSGPSHRSKQCSMTRTVWPISSKKR